MAIDKSDYRHVFATVFTHAEELLLSVKQHPDVLNQYFQSWHEIAKKAVELDNPALQDVILLFIDACNSAFKKTKDITDLTEVQWQLLNKWDHLFASYIDRPNDQQIALALIQCLNDPLLAMGLEPEDEQMLLDSFQPVIAQLSPDNQQEQLPQAVIVKQDQLAEVEPSSIWDKLRILIREAELNLKEVLVQQVNIASLTYSEALRHYLESWSVIAKVIDAENSPALSKFLDVVFLFIDFNSQLFNQPDSLNNEQQAILKQWHQLFSRYIQAQGSQQLAVALVKCLHNPSWLQPLSGVDEKTLLEDLGVVDEPNVNRSALIIPIAEQSSKALVPVKTVATQTQQDSVWQKLAKPFADAVVDLQAIVVAQEQQNNESFSKQLQNYQQNWQQIAAIIETDGKQAGLLDIVLLFTEISSSAFEQLNLSNPHLARLKKWHGLFDNYIKGRGDTRFVAPLIKCLADPIWPEAIEAKDEQILLANFQDITVPNSPAATAIAEQPAVQKVLPPALTIPETEVITVAPLVETSELADVPTAVINLAEQPDTSFQAVAVKKLPLWQQLEPLFNQTTLNLTDAIEQLQANAEVALKENLQRYLENWLAIAQQIEIDAEQPGLVDVVLLFIEVTRQAFEQLKDISKEQMMLLDKWQSLFSRYLEKQGDRQLATELIKCLSDPLWSGAITVEDEEMLLAGFATIPEAPPELASKFDDSLTNEVVESTEQANKADLESDIDGKLTEEVFELIEELPESGTAEETESTLDLEFADESFNITAESQPEFVLYEDSESDIDLIYADESSAETEQSISDESQQDSIWHKIEPVFAQTTVSLQAAIEDVSAFKQHLQIYVEQWQAITDIVGSDESLPGLFDMVLLFSEIAKQTFNPIDSLTSEQTALLNTWQDLFADYFKNQNNPQVVLGLIQCLRSSLWSEPIDAEDEPMLLESFGIDASVLISSTSNEQPSLTEYVAATIEPEKHPIWQNFALFFDDTETKIQAMLELIATNNNRNCREYLQQYADDWLVIAEIIAENEGLKTLADTTLLFADNCMEWVEQNVILNADRLHLLQLWHTDFAVYLHDISSTASANNLIVCLDNSLWLHPLTAEDKGMLLDMMFEETHESSMFAEKSENLLMFDASDEFPLFADESELEEPAKVSTLEQTDSADLAMFADEELEATTDDEMPLFAEEIAAHSEQPQVSIEASKAETETTAQESALLDEELPDKPAVSVNPELIGMVRDEFALLVTDINAEISTATDTQAFKVVLKNHEFKFQNLAKACHTIGLLGLEQVFEQLSLNMRCRRDSDTLTDSEAELFKEALPLIQDYLNAITERNKALTLLAHLAASGWKQPLTEAQIKPLLDLLTSLALGSNKQQLDNRKTVAELADISLKLPSDVNHELLDSLLNELPVLTGNFSSVIQKIISGTDDVQKLLEAQRIAHTLKGSGNIVGVSGIAVLTHHLEEILEYLTEHKTFPPKALAEVLLESADCLEMMCDLMLNGENQPPDQALQVLQNVLNWANQIATSGLPTENIKLESTTTLPAQPDTDITPVVQEAKAVEAVAMTRVPSEVIDKLLRMTGEGSILSEQFKERIKRFSDELKNLNELTWQIQTLVAELDQAINIQSYSVKKGRSGEETEFDALEMEQYNELHTAASRISEMATDIREINIHMDEQLIDLKYLMIEEDAIQKENQEMVQSIRMVPANTIASRCQRIVRQACRATNKEVELEIKGADILIDSEILNDMVEPLMHLLRNSIDHGIEPVHIREKYNKPKIGKITLEFSRKGNYAVITCKDDGGGLANGNILQTAIKKGLISAKQQLTDAEIHKLILIPGFSTRAVATQTSGRGIGMDAIQTKISSIQGQMSLSSVRGEGLTIDITVPLTLSSMLSLLIKCGSQTMAISNRGLRKIHHADECLLVQEDEQLFCDIDYKRYPAKYFAELVGIPVNYDIGVKLPALRIEDEIGRTHIVLVDELLGYRDLLVKNMGSYIPHIQGITGASILGNGAVAPVIDLVEMLHHAAKYDYVLADATKALADSINGLPMALVVDDSLSARRAVAMLLKDSGIQVETAIDGLDAIKHIEKTMPDLLVVDLEMPRMNGIELTAHVRGREAMKDTPIIMITSRATEKHRKQAEAAGVTKFMTKPFTEDDLINNVRLLIK